MSQVIKVEDPMKSTSLSTAVNANSLKPNARSPGSANWASKGLPGCCLLGKFSSVAREAISKVVVKELSSFSPSEVGINWRDDCVKENQGIGMQLVFFLVLKCSFKVNIVSKDRSPILRLRVSLDTELVIKRDFLN